MAGVLGFPKGADVASIGEDVKEPTGTARNSWDSSSSLTSRSSSCTGTVGRSTDGTSAVPCATPGAAALTECGADDGADDDAVLRSPCAETKESSGAAATSSDLGEHVVGAVNNVDISGSPEVAAVDQSFGPIPDENWGSDHLALGVELALRTNC